MLLGKLGYKPWELHRITFKEVVLSIDGHHEQNKFFIDYLQLATRMVVLSGFNGRAASAAMNKAWPFERAKGGIQISERAKAQLRQLRESEAKQRAKNKLDGRRNETGS